MMKSRIGNAIVISVSRDTIVSIVPPKYPAIEPISTPTNMLSIVARSATSSETWVP